MYSFPENCRTGDSRHPSTIALSIHRQFDRQSGKSNDQLYLYVRISFGYGTCTVFNKDSGSHGSKYFESINWSNISNTYRMLGYKN